MSDTNNNDKHKDREFTLKVIQNAFWMLLTIGLLLAGYKVVSIRVVDTVIFDFAPPDSQPQKSSSTNSTLEAENNSNTESQTQIIPDPEDFIRYYFDAITSQRNYDYLWSLQTEDFHREASNNSYNDYVSYWNTIDDIKVNSINFYDQTAYTIRCRTKMSFYKQGENIPVDLVFYLVYDKGKGSWVFDVP